MLRPVRVRAALVIMVLLLSVAALADLLAADLPLVLHIDGELHLLPNLTRPAQLRAWNNQQLERALRAQGDWAIFPPIAWGQNSHDLEAVLAPPSTRHWLGTDSSGRDVCARIVHGTRVSLSVGLGSALLIACFGLSVGLLAGYCGGFIDSLLMRCVDALHAVPTLLLLVTMLSVLRPSGRAAVFSLLLVIGLVRWTDLARLVRAETRRVRALPYIEAARALGLSAPRIIVRHLLPNLLSPVLVAASFSMGAAIVLEGALSFLGFGMPPDVASWGSLLGDAREHVEAWWLALAPGLALFLSIAAYNQLAEAVRDSVDPTLDL
jgi:peptide/nickel transport system permease protein